MSGISVVLNRGQGTVSRNTFKKMLGRIDHRGPDGRDAWYSNRIGMGHQQLQSTPEGKYDDQPLNNDGLVIAADARIDNRSELLETLPVEEPHSEIPDSRLILEAYRQWKTECVEHLIGAFAFVVWDRHAERLYCARDHLGVKPLYYYKNNNLFIASSEKKSILEHPEVPREVNETKIGDFLTKTYTNKQYTFFQSLQRVPPAHAMTVGESASQSWQYWDLDPTRKISLNSDKSYERRFRELFEQAVSSRLRGDAPPGTFLSGGMDSSSITVVANDILSGTDTLHTFSNVFPDTPTADERGFIESVVSRDGITPHYINPNESGSLVDIDTLFDHFDQPPHNTAHFLRWERIKTVDDVGVKTVLDGALGDQTVGYGLTLLPQLLVTGHWVKLWNELTAMSDILETSKKNMFKRHILRDLVPDPVLRFRRRLKNKPHEFERANRTLNPEFVKRTNLRERYIEENQKRLGIIWNNRRDHCNGLTGARIPTSFETTDLIAAAFGIEPRYPFTDVRLIEFCTSIPPTQRFKNGWTRSILRRSLDGLLPEKVQWRPWKAQLDRAFYNGLRAEERLITNLTDNPGRVEAYLDTDAYEQTYDEFTNEPEHRTARAIWSGLSLWAWLDRCEYVG